MRYRQTILYFLLAVIGALLYRSDPLSAQTTNPVYWRYDAPGRLNQITVADIDGDNVDEFIVVSDDVNLVLVGADGSALWERAFQADEPIIYTITISFANQTPGSIEIVAATSQYIYLIDASGQQVWRRTLETTPSDIKSYKPNDNEADRLLIAYANGELRQYGSQGELIWRYEHTDTPSEDASPTILVADLNRDGQREIIFTYLSEAGFSKIVVLGQSGHSDWERSNSGEITAIIVTEFFEEADLEIAVATSLNRIYLYSSEGDRRWPYRSINVPITSLTMSMLDQGPALIVGTAAGTVVAYDQLGRRYWADSTLDEPGSEIIGISAPPYSFRKEQPVALAVLISGTSQAAESTNIILLDSDGQRLEPVFPGIDAAGLSRLVDINRDGISELLIASFATMELLDPGIGARQFFESWDYRLGAEPTAALLADIDLDDNTELLVGTSDGSLHALRSDGSLIWEIELGGIISGLAVARPSTESLPVIIVIYNEIISGEEGIEGSFGSVAVLRPDSRIIWQTNLDTTISTISTSNINRTGPPELLVGTADGQVISYSLSGEEFWRTSLSSSVDKLALMIGARANEIIVMTGADSISRINIKGSRWSQIAGYLEDITTLDLVDLDNFDFVLLIGLDDGTLRSLSTKGNQIWTVPLQGTPNISLPLADSLLIGTDEQELSWIDYNGNTIWTIQNMGHITSLYWGDLDGDVQPDIAVGDRDGHLRLLSLDTDVWQTIDLISDVFFVSAIRRLPDLPAELVAITDNGLVQLFEPQANRPPLLIKPEIEVDQGEYTVAITVIDVENDPVSVSLEVQDPETLVWADMGEKVATDGVDKLFWSVNPPDDALDVSYRIKYDDGSHTGELAPAKGPPPIVADSPFSNLAIGLIVVAIMSAGTLLYINQRRSPAINVRRYYQRRSQQPQSALDLLSQEYNSSGGSPDFLLNIANRSRKQQDETLASLADGLFLLTVRPDSALSLINSALEEAKHLDPAWENLSIWQETYRLGQMLYAVPTFTEIALLYPQLEQLIQQRNDSGHPSEAIAGLLSVLASLRDSERVDLASDRLVYLNEAIGLMRQLQYQRRFWPTQCENTLVNGIIDRWFGLVTAEIEELHGKAQLVLSLLTKNLILGDSTTVALEIENLGRAPAERIVVELAADPAFAGGATQHIPFLPPGRTRQLYFEIKPNVVDKLRVVFNLTYDDRSGHNKSEAFADMVHLIKKEREFKPINNPYSPGMPLRSKSTVFFGRNDLFEFIQSNSGQPEQHNVLILIGQRRTGKTSALLQIEHHLPDHLIPVYIDCQGLGVTPGMPAFLHDVAWVISDALAGRGYDLVVPSLSEWKRNATGLFQRNFLPSVRETIPDNSTILLIFDEFEALEDLVRVEILPATIFTYLRHLMQHAENLNFIFAGTHRLEEMGSDYWSVLFNSALYRHVGFLSFDATRHLIRDPVAPDLTYDDLAVDKIIRVTAGHPYFLQLVCYTLVNQANTLRQGYVTISNVNDALNEMLRLGEVHFAYLWQRSSFTEKALLAAASRLMDRNVPLRPEDMVRFLEKYRFYLDPGEVTAGLNQLVEREIMRELAGDGMAQYELRIGLVGLWVAQNKSLSRLYEKSIENL